MKKWIIFLSVSCAACIIVLGFQITFLKDAVHEFNVMKEYYANNALDLDPSELNSIYVLPLVGYSISSFLVLGMLVFNAFFLASIILRKITPLSISENLAAWKEHRAARKAERKQRKLEKAQAKVEQLQEEIQKDDE